MSSFPILGKKRGGISNHWKNRAAILATFLVTLAAPAAPVEKAPTPAEVGVPAHLTKAVEGTVVLKVGQETVLSSGGIAVQNPTVLETGETISGRLIRKEPTIWQLFAPVVMLSEGENSAKIKAVSEGKGYVQSNQRGHYASDTPYTNIYGDVFREKPGWAVAIWIVVVNKTGKIGEIDKPGTGLPPGGVKPDIARAVIKGRVVLHDTGEGVEGADIWLIGDKCGTIQGGWKSGGNGHFTITADNLLCVDRYEVMVQKHSANVKKADAFEEDLWPIQEYYVSINLKNCRNVDVGVIVLDSVSNLWGGVKAPGRTNVVDRTPKPGKKDKPAAPPGPGKGVTKPPAQPPADTGAGGTPPTTGGGTAGTTPTTTTSTPPGTGDEVSPPEEGDSSGEGEDEGEEGEIEEPEEDEADEVVTPGSGKRGTQAPAGESEEEQEEEPEEEEPEEEEPEEEPEEEQPPVAPPPGEKKKPDIKIIEGHPKPPQAPAETKPSTWKPLPPAGAPAGPKKVSDLSKEELDGLLHCLCRASSGASFGTYSAYNPKPVKESPACEDPSNGPCVAGNWGCWRSFIRFDTPEALGCLMSYGLTNNHETIKALDEFNKAVEKPLQIELVVDRERDPDKWCIEINAGEPLHLSVRPHGGRPPYRISWSAPYHIKARTGAVGTDEPDLEYIAMEGDYSGSWEISVCVWGSGDSPNNALVKTGVAVCVHGNPAKKKEAATKTPAPAAKPTVSVSHPPSVTAPASPPSVASPVRPSAPSVPGPRPSPAPVVDAPPPPVATVPAPKAPPAAKETEEAPPAVGKEPPASEERAKDSSGREVPKTVKPPSAPGGSAGEDDCSLGGGGYATSEGAMVVFGEVPPGRRVRVTIVGTDGFSQTAEGFGRAEISRPRSPNGRDTIIIEDVDRPECSQTREQAYDEMGTPVMGSLQEAEAGVLTAPAGKGPALVDDLTASKTDRSFDNAGASIGLMDAQTRVEKASTAADRTVKDAARIRDQAGAGASDAAADSARKAAAADAKSSWGATLADAVADSVEEGLKATATAFGSAAADEAADAIFDGGGKSKDKGESKGAAEGTGSVEGAGEETAGASKSDSGHKGTDKHHDKSHDKKSKGPQESMTCPSCGKTVTFPAGKMPKWCPNCGAGPGSVECAHCGYRWSGKKGKAPSKCPKCGARMSGDEEREQEEKVDEAGPGDSGFGEAGQQEESAGVSASDAGVKKVKKAKKKGKAP
ncbi:MAG: hypothetical protein JXB04_12850 [Kiritimatiellae bacterium]|nr:hypothetical protein [Kiritimatiellia bacterium]